MWVSGWIILLIFHINLTIGMDGLGEQKPDSSRNPAQQCNQTTGIFLYEGLWKNKQSLEHSPVTILWYDYNWKIELLWEWIGCPTNKCQNMALLAISVFKISSWILFSWKSSGSIEKIEIFTVLLSWKTIGMWLGCYSWATGPVVTQDRSNQSNQLRLQCKFHVMTSWHPQVKEKFKSSCA